MALILRIVLYIFAYFAASSAFLLPLDMVILNINPTASRTDVGLKPSLLFPLEMCSSYILGQSAEDISITVAAQIMADQCSLFITKVICLKADHVHRSHRQNTGKKGKEKR